MKQCSACGETLPLSHFHKNRTKPDGHQYRCKDCAKEYFGGWYKDNAENHKRNVKRNTYKFKQKYYEFMQTQSCTDCGETRVATLQWDHIDPSTKSFNIADALRLGYGWDKIMAEIEKCVCRCGNCHAVRTEEQFGWYKYQDKIDSLS